MLPKTEHINYQRVNLDTFMLFKLISFDTLSENQNENYLFNRLLMLLGELFVKFKQTHYVFVAVTPIENENISKHFYNKIDFLRNHKNDRYYYEESESKKWLGLISVPATYSFLVEDITGLEQLAKDWYEFGEVNFVFIEQNGQLKLNKEIVQLFSFQKKNIAELDSLKIDIICNFSYVNLDIAVNIKCASLVENILNQYK